MTRSICKICAIEIRSSVEPIEYCSLACQTRASKEKAFNDALVTIQQLLEENKQLKEQINNPGYGDTSLLPH